MSHSKLTTDFSHSSETMVQVDAHTYQLMMAQLKKYETKLRAYSHLPNLLHEKEKELERSKDRLRQLEPAYMQLHHQFANTIRLQTMEQAHKPKNVMETDSSASDKDEVIHLRGRGMPPPCDSGPKLKERSASEVQSPFGDRSKIFTDDCTTMTTSLPRWDGSPRKRPSQPVFGKSQMSDNGSSVKSVSSVPDIKKMQAIHPPGPSMEVFDRVVEKNVELQSKLQKIERSLPIDISKFLTIKEYEEVISNLRQELSRIKIANEELSVLSFAQDSGSEESIAQKCADLIRKVTRLEKTICSKNALIESYGSEYEKLRKQFLDLQEQLSKKGVSEVEPSFLQPPDSMDTTVGAAASVSAAQMSQELTQLRFELEQQKQEKELLHQKCDEMTKAVQTMMLNRSQLDQYPETMNELRREHKRMREEIQLLKHTIKQYKDEKGILTAQVNIFQEDFNNERKEKIALQKKSEDTIKQLQQQVAPLRQMDQPKVSPKKASMDSGFIPSGGSYDTGSPGVSYNTGSPGVSYNTGSPGVSYNTGSPGLSYNTGSSDSGFDRHSYPQVDGCEGGGSTGEAQTSSGCPYQCERCLTDFKHRKDYETHVQRCNLGD